MFNSAKKVLVFGAHGDDEIIGCGGTIVRLVSLGVLVRVVTFTRRETSYAIVRDKNRAAEMAEKEMSAADDILGVERKILGLPNQGVENNRDNFQLCTKLIREYQPDIILTHGPQDHHRDHRAVSELVSEARWKAGENLSPDWGEPWQTQWVLQFEIFDLITKPHMIYCFNSACLRKKVEAMRSQVSQLEVLGPIIQHISGLSGARGASVGARWGEAFKIDDFHPAKF